MAFLLSAPAVNPVVLVSTSVAFPGQPRVVAARAMASALTATTVGLIWSHLAKPGWTRAPRCAVPLGCAWKRFRLTLVHDFVDGASMLVVGAAATATLRSRVDPASLAAIARWPPAGVVLAGGLAVVLCVCSEADAFVASSLAGLSPVARLAFMVVGPAVDLKLIAMQSGTFGPRFAIRFAPLAFTVALASSAGVGWWLLR